ncbi:thioredoxin, mitochondrial [Glossina fuscipes]|uniref:Thioredoxin, mitochondrial n=1 Tax=Glossina fuscipes TaxID=7396 RepID=A0A8U0W4A7_9MUSC|nr:thioredoxin, mitochondrial [Glossina fuscipes]XP_037880044.1 thioredoxin, mitochondrial [Glossina fuscipes]XP_037880045.1 thioredoxin, mitochondrial [Glossina fuscipes]
MLSTHICRTNARRAFGQLVCMRRHFGTTLTKKEIFQVQSTEDFEQKVKKSDKVVIVDFFATWCNPCKMLTPRLESIVGEKAGSVKLAKVDIDEHSDLALDYEVGAVPVLMAMKNGKVVNRMIGLQDTDKLRAWIEKTVAENK